MAELISSQKIEQMIHLVRGHRVMMDADLARIYGVTTARLNEQVKRNLDRFPLDFMFQLTRQEFETLMLQFATSKQGRGGRHKLPRVFTEHGVIMLASVLNSTIAVQASIQIVRTFAQLRQMFANHAELAKKLAELERRLEGHDEAIHDLFETIRQLLTPPPAPKRRIGFHGGAEGKLTGRGYHRL